MSSSLTEDKNPYNLGDEDFKSLLDELVTFDKPESEKSPLVRKLAADVSKDESSLMHQNPYDVLSSSLFQSTSSWTSSAASAATSRSGDQQPGSRKSSSRNRPVPSDQMASSQSQQQQNGGNSQSLQDLASIDSKSVAKTNSSSRRLGKCPRANSFTQEAEGSSSSAAGRVKSGAVSHSGPLPAPSTSSSSVKKAYTCNKNTSSSSSASFSSTILSSPSAAAAATTTTTTTTMFSSSASSCASYPQARASSSPIKYHPLPSDTTNNRLTSSNSNVNNTDCDVETGRSGSSSRIFTQNLRTYSNPSYSSSNNTGSIVSTSSSSRSCQPSAGVLSVCRQESLIEELDNAVELQDMRKKAEIVNVSSLSGGRSTAAPSLHDVDSVVHFNRLDPCDPIDPQLAELRSLADYNSGRNAAAHDLLQHQQQDRRQAAGTSNDSDSALLNRSATTPGNVIINRRVVKSKKNREEPKILAGDLAGNIGDKDVDYLTHYVIGQEARTAARRERKVTDRSKDNKKKTPERSNSQPESGSSEEKVMDKMPKGRSTSPLDRPSSGRPSSPSHATSVASYAPDELISREEFSDDEKGYHTDQDSGFQVMKGKKRYNRHNRMSRLPDGNRHHLQSVRPNLVTAAASSSPTTSSPSFSTAAFSVSGASASVSGSANLTSRGYESEKEFYPDNYSNRQASVHRRKTASSMPHSERNSPENSDVDSSLSLPIVHRPLLPTAPAAVIADDNSGRISYAQIARSASVSTPATVATLATQSTPISSSSSVARCTNSSTSNGISKAGAAAVASVVTASIAKNRAQGKTVPQKSNSARENVPSTCRLENEGQELVSAPPAETSRCESTAVNIVDDRLIVSDTVIEATSKSRPFSPSKTPTLQGSAAVVAEVLAPADNHQQIRKHNSIPETGFKSMIKTKSLNRSLDSAHPPLELPAVIMCEDSVAGQDEIALNGRPSGPFTFGFFDDLTDDDVSASDPKPDAGEEQKVESGSEEMNHPVSASTCTAVDGADVPAFSVPEQEDEAAGERLASEEEHRTSSCTGKRPMAQSISFPPDVDIETFNYNEILAYIRKAWEGVTRAERTVYARSFSSGSATTPEKTSLA